MTEPPSRTSTFRRNVLSCLTKLSHGSAPFIAIFAVIHLTAPAMANLGGSSLASQTMILGREYYQTSFGEKYLLLAPLTIHSLAGLTKRLLSSPPQNPHHRPLSSFLSLTGYATLFFFLPIHYTTHRLLPASPDTPIHSVGPAELDFEFVKHGLQNYPWTSWVLYTGLVGAVALHVADGFDVIQRTWFGGNKTHENVVELVSQTRRRRKSRALAVGGLVLPVLSGLFVIWREPPLIFSSMAKRFEAVFVRSGVYFN